MRSPWMAEALNFVGNKIRATAMNDGSIRNVGVIFNATSMDGGNAEFRRERIRATAMDAGSIRNAGAISNAQLPHSLY